MTTEPNTRQDFVLALRALARALQTHLPYPGAEQAATQLRQIAADIVRDLAVRP